MVPKDDDQIDIMEKQPLLDTKSKNIKISIDNKDIIIIILLVISIVLTLYLVFH